MTDTTITTLFASGMTALVAVIGGLPVLLVAMTNLKQSRANAKAAELEASLAIARAREAKEKADEIIGKADEIHTLTNSNLSQVTAALALANEKIQGMEKLLVSMSHKKANGGEEA